MALSANERVRRYNERHPERVRETQRKYREKHPERIKNWNNDKRRFASEKERYQTLKRQVFEQYGMKCVCCGEENYKLLTLDHVNSDGYLDKVSPKTKGRIRGTPLFVKIIKDCYPTKYQLQCWNCNSGRAHNDTICPHQEERTIIDEYIAQYNGVNES